ncbi:helix-turn-helix domain-containing protein [Bradyrhizobium sp.]|uniref:helix-turn-helix domain-containing protein n=1 Tax=Bradyrhizobium sp. TaxID=376 RepID=UPI0039E29668
MNWPLKPQCRGRHFSKRFRSLTGLAPLDYLLRWRMRLACDWMRRGATVSATGAHVGYASEKAFGHVFKRVTAMRRSGTRVDLPAAKNSPPLRINCRDLRRRVTQKRSCLLSEARDYFAAIESGKPQGAQKGTSP